MAAHVKVEERKTEGLSITNDGTGYQAHSQMEDCECRNCRMRTFKYDPCRPVRFEVVIWPLETEDLD